MRLMPRWCVRNQLLTAYLLWLPAMCIMLAVEQYEDHRPVIGFLRGFSYSTWFISFGLLISMYEKSHARMVKYRLKSQAEFADFCDKQSQENLLRMKERDTLWRAKFRKYIKEQALKYGFEWRDD